MYDIEKLKEVASYYNVEVSLYGEDQDKLQMIGTNGDINKFFKEAKRQGLLSKDSFDESYKVVDEKGNKVEQGGGFTLKKEAELFAAQYGQEGLKVVRESYNAEETSWMDDLIDVLRTYPNNDEIENDAFLKELRELYYKHYPNVHIEEETLMERMDFDTLYHKIKYQEDLPIKEGLIGTLLFDTTFANELYDEFYRPLTDLIKKGDKEGAMKEWQELRDDFDHSQINNKKWAKTFIEVQEARLAKYKAQIDALEDSKVKEPVMIENFIMDATRGLKDTDYVIALKHPETGRHSFFSKNSQITANLENAMPYTSKFEAQDDIKYAEDAALQSISSNDQFYSDRFIVVTVSEARKLQGMHETKSQYRQRMKESMDSDTRSIEIIPYEECDECPYLLGNDSNQVDIQDRYSLLEDELWATGWIGAVQNCNAGPFNSFDELDIYCYDREKGVEYDLPEIPEDMKNKFLVEVNKYIEEVGTIEERYKPHTKRLLKLIGSDKLDESNSEINNLSANEYELVYYENTACRDRRPETFEDVEDDWHEIVFRADSDLDAWKEAFERVTEASYDDYLDEDATEEDFVEHFNYSDWSDGSPILISLKSSEETLFDTGYTKESWTGEFITDEDYDDYEESYTPIPEDLDDDFEGPNHKAENVDAENVDAENVEFVMTKYISDSSGVKSVTKINDTTYKVLYDGTEVEIVFEFGWDEWVYTINGKGPFVHSSYEWIISDIRKSFEAKSSLEKSKQLILKNESTIKEIISDYCETCDEYNDEFNDYDTYEDSDMLWDYHSKLKDSLKKLGVSKAVIEAIEEYGYVFGSSSDFNYEQLIADLDSLNEDDILEYLNESYFGDEPSWLDDEDPVDADREYANLYGGDRIYCDCGTKLQMDEWGSYCPKCNAEEKVLTEEMEKLATNSKGDYLVSADSGHGWSVYNRSGVCIGGINDDDANDDNEAIRLFKSNRLSEAFDTHSDIDLDMVGIRVANLLSVETLGEDNWIEFDCKDSRGLIGTPDLHMSFSATGASKMIRGYMRAHTDGTIDVYVKNGSEGKFRTPEEIARFIAGEFGISL